MTHEQRIAITICLTVVCTAALIFSKGDTGAGWFVLGLILIWNL